MPVDDLDAGLASVASGAADVVHVPPSYDGVVDDVADSGVTVAYALHAAAPALRDAAVRRGLVAAIDPDVVAAALPGLVPADATDPTLGEGDPSLQLPGSVSLTIVGAEPDGPWSDRSGAEGTESALAGSVAAQWGEAGVDVVVQDVTLEGFVALVAGGGHEVIRTGWVELYPGDRPQWLLVDAGEQHQHHRAGRFVARHARCVERVVRVTPLR